VGGTAGPADPQAGGGNGGSEPAPPPAPAPDLTGTLVPLYSYPTNPAWRMVIDAKLAHPTVPVVAVINPSNGPGASKNTDFANGIAALAKAGVRVLGYVSTSYTKRAESLVHADIDTYRSWYPEVSGIFFDEQANTVGNEDYYRRVDAYARTKGFDFTVGNPGADTAPSYVGTVDMILIYESSGLPAGNKANADWHANYDRHNFGIIPYGVQTLDAAYIAQVKSKVGYVYVTGDTLPNPWDTVPAYFGDLLAQLEK
ncbi:MAG TPA: spherulation-specific family 4 protein, partial [Polyangia bacterium]|nr:spherulation-specific family 4 protein [Polyangia bacterium]